MLALTRPRLFATAAVTAVALLVSWYRRPHASLDECAALLDRYVELRVRARWPEGTEAWVREQQLATRAKAAREPSFLACPQEVDRAEFACAMGAPTADELEKCLE